MKDEWECQTDKINAKRKINGKICTFTEITTCKKILSKDEAYEWYWAGKSKKMREAVEEWIRNPRGVTQDELSTKYNVSSGSITHHLSTLRKKGFKIPSSHPQTFCLKCGKDLDRKEDKVLIVHPVITNYLIKQKIEFTKNKLPSGYICTKCLHQIFPQIKDYRSTIERVKNKNDIKQE